MAWRVREGIKVSHDNQYYVAGQVVPCTNEQAAAMPHAVELVEALVPSKPAPVTVEVLDTKAQAKRNR